MAKEKQKFIQQPLFEDFLPKKEEKTNNEMGIVRGEYAASTERPYNHVYVDGEYLDPKESLKLENHSPDGFNWGYEGSGPSQLALALLLHFTKDKRFSVLFHNELKSDIISLISQGSDFSINKESIIQWIEKKRNGEGSIKEIVS